MRFIRKAGAHAEKSPKRLHVEPAELARKLVKEMEDHKVSRSNRVYVRNRYTVYLCPEDFDNLQPRAAEITAGLTNKLARHVEDMQYLLQGELKVEMVLDPELELGFFGILAQRIYPQQETPGAPAPVGASDGDQAEPMYAPSAALAASVPAAAAPAAVGTAGAAAVGGAAAAAAVGATDSKLPAPTQVIAASEAEQLGLARRVIVVRAGDVVREFSQSRVVLGRGREADFRIDDSNVSREACRPLLERGSVDARRPGFHQRHLGQRLPGHQHRPSSPGRHRDRGESDHGGDQVGRCAGIRLRGSPDAPDSAARGEVRLPHNPLSVSVSGHPLHHPRAAERRSGSGQAGLLGFGAVGSVHAGSARVAGGCRRRRDLDAGGGEEPRAPGRRRVRALERGRLLWSAARRIWTSSSRTRSCRPSTLSSRSRRRGWWWRIWSAPMEPR